MVSAHEAMICVLEVGFQGDDCLGSQLFDLSLDVSDVASTGGQFLVDVREELFGGVVVGVHEGGVWLFEFIRVFV